MHLNIKDFLSTDGHASILIFGKLQFDSTGNEKSLLKVLLEPFNLNLKPVKGKRKVKPPDVPLMSNPLDSPVKKLNQHIKLLPVTRAI